MLRVRLLGGLGARGGRRARSSRPRAAPRASCWPGSRCHPGRSRGSSSRCASGPTCPRRAPAPACARRCTSCAARSATPRRTSRSIASASASSTSGSTCATRPGGGADRRRAARGHRPRLGDRGPRRAPRAGRRRCSPRCSRDGPDGLRWAREAGPARPAVGGGRATADDAARRRRRPRGGDVGYVRLEDRLERELSVAPSRQTRRLLAEIRAGAAPPLGTGDRHRALPPVKGPLRRPRRGAARRCSRTRRGAVLLAGEPGIGKTRLLAEAGRLAHERGATVLLRALLRGAGRAVRAVRGGARGGDVRARCSDDAHGERWRLFEAIGARLEGTRAAARRPPLGRRRHAAAARAPAAPPEPPRRARRLPRHRDRPHPPARRRRSPTCAATASSSASPLRGLDAAAVAELVRRRHAPADLAARLHRETGGNPFFVEEVLGTSPRRPSASCRSPKASRTSSAAASSRLAPETEPRARRRRRRRPRVRPRAARSRARRRRAGCARGGRAAQMVREEPGRPGRYAFAHALVRETLYDELSLTRRVRTHRALADALERLPGRSLAELAHHRLAGRRAAAPPTPRSPPPREAMRALAYEEAAGLCERGARGASRTDDQRRAELLLALGEARLRAGRTRRATRSREAAALARTLGTAGAARPRRARVQRARRDDHRRRPRGGRPARGGAASCARRRSAPGSSRGSRSRPTTRRRPSSARRSATRRWPLRAGTARRCSTRSTPATPRCGARSTSTSGSPPRDEMLALAIARGDAERELQARNWLVLDLLRARRPRRHARPRSTRTSALAARLRLPALRVVGPDVALDAGDPRRPLRRRRGADRAARRRSSDPNARLYAEIQASRSTGTAVASTSSTRRRSSARSGGPAEYAYRAGYSWVLASRAATTRRARTSTGSRADDFARLGDDMNRLAALAELAQAMRALGDPTHAAGVLERLEPYADRNVPTAAAPPATARPPTTSPSSRRCSAAMPGRASSRRSSATPRSVPALGGALCAPR